MRRLPVLPAMRCDDGCGACCGPAPCSPRELEVVRAYVAQHHVEPRRQGITCPLYLGGRCSVYPARPLVCQLFGHVPELKCERGYNANAGRSARREWDRAFDREKAPGQVRHVHEVAYSARETDDIIRAYWAGLVASSAGAGA